MTDIETATVYLDNDTCFEVDYIKNKAMPGLSDGRGGPTMIPAEPETVELLEVRMQNASGIDVPLLERLNKATLELIEQDLLEN